MERSVGIHPDCVKFDIQISAMTLDTRRGGFQQTKGNLFKNINNMLNFQRIRKSSLDYLGGNVSNSR